MPSHGDRLLDSVCSFLPTGECYQRQAVQFSAGRLGVRELEWNGLGFVFTDTDSVTDFVFTFQRYLLNFCFVLRQGFSV